ncbi:VOC family protein [Allomesorhizobium camelthorni]|uniref:Glyoxalase n=1 Tax=Allomesorhizobium camelthorni TaxID=475069 RepID=A0A6G4WLW0_9HYPH|nr:VOC family protein [Mesorhizobium camelthorni]NGO55614.1 glyoxalase [Mesorhizobium camelthorni]
MTDNSIPSSKPLFTETMQIGMVVRDLDATVRAYESFGVGPWERFEIPPEYGTDVTIEGKPSSLHTRVACANIGSVQWELIQPLDPQSIYGRFLAEKGEGVHHIAVRTLNFAEMVAREAALGRGLLLRGTFSGIDLAYLDTTRELGVPIEIGSLPEYQGS